MKILYILRLLSGNPAKSRLLLWLPFSWLSSRAFCKPGLLNLGKCFMTVFMTSKQVISLSLPRGNNKGLVDCPGSPSLRCSLVGGPHALGRMLSPSIRRALAARRRACQQPSSARRKAHGRQPYAVRAASFRGSVLVQTNSFILGPTDIQREKVIGLRSQPKVSDF